MHKVRIIGEEQPRQNEWPPELLEAVETPLNEVSDLSLGRVQFKKLFPSCPGARFRFEKLNNLVSALESVQ